MAVAAIPYLLAGGTALSTIGSIQQGKAIGVQSDFQAKQLEATAKTEKALSAKQANEEAKRTRILTSNAKAAIAAGGGNTADVGSLNILTDIVETGELNALTALWEGNERAAGRNNAANATRLEGSLAKKASKIDALSTVFSGAANASKKY